MMTDPRLTVMHRYVEEYTNGHDLAVARQIMHPGYRFTMGATTLDLESYLAMVDGALDHFADLRLVVNEFVVGPERLAMAFTETASSPRHNRSAAWRGVALYTFHPDGRLLAVTVQQDFWGRRMQLLGRAPQRLAGTTDPDVWDTPVRAASSETQTDLRVALANLESTEATYDNGDDLAVMPTGVVVVDTVVAGDRFAAAIEIAGTSTAAENDSDLFVPGEVVVAAAGVGTVTDRSVTDAHFVTDRWSLWTSQR